jgi:hypothetical protein
MEELGLERHIHEARWIVMHMESHTDFPQAVAASSIEKTWFDA